ncbi:PGF-pre-PGF domain-containing protein [Methanosarcina barkeri]|uniref:PGF-pre-PGF domain-containing protein n=1 Tax=Methanosarcina barkeri TaxID=2208 RepID=UPI00312038F0
MKKWEQFPANLSGEDDKYLNFKAKTSGFSSFAITGTAKPLSEETVTKINIDDPETIKINADNPETIKINIDDPETINNTTNKEPQTEQKEIPRIPSFEIYYGIASLFAVILYKRK